MAQDRADIEKALDEISQEFKGLRNRIMAKKGIDDSIYMTSLCTELGALINAMSLARGVPFHELLKLCKSVVEDSTLAAQNVSMEIGIDLPDAHKRHIDAQVDRIIAKAVRG